jgi:uncharacterized protein
MPAPPAGPQASATGIGWRHPHYAELLETLPRLGFLEVHSENFFAAGGAALATLEQARRDYSVSLHGVGLGLGSACGVDPWHLNRLQSLVQRIDPVRVSDHACFARGTLKGAALHAVDLLPIPFNRVSLDVLCANVQQVQDRLQRSILVENLSAYVQMPGDDRPESEFLQALAQRTGCQLLVDVNNIYVNALNAGRLRTVRRAPGTLEPLHAPAKETAANRMSRAVRDCCEWLNGIAPACVGEIHLAGHSDMGNMGNMGNRDNMVNLDDKGERFDLVIDDHGALVCDGVWQVYEHAVRRFGDVPALVEWDTAIPPLQVLLDEARRADAIQQRCRTQPALKGSP